MLHPVSANGAGQVGPVGQVRRAREPERRPGITGKATYRAIPAIPHLPCRGRISLFFGSDPQLLLNPGKLADFRFRAEKEHQGHSE
ncbi:MAG: hypothetical protein E7055_13055 [Lentisphaerae bacterium]|nr:hypothetical protein [Lentisphaerota bacterium]